MITVFGFNDIGRRLLFIAIPVYQRGEHSYFLAFTPPDTCPCLIRF